jgi:hypothetical protein
LAVALLSVVLEARADVFCQPPSGPIQNEWREAGAVFLEGIAQIVTGLARIEASDIPGAQSEMTNAGKSLRKAHELYQSIASHISRPRAINLNKLSTERLRIMQGFFEHSGPKLPSDERQAALVAGGEALGLAEVLEKDKELFTPRIEDLQALLVEVTRTLQRGTILTELMKSGLTEG